MSEVKLKHPLPKFYWLQMDNTYVVLDMRGQSVGIEYLIKNDLGNEDWYFAYYFN